jgi:hypothetical protein
VPWLAGGPPPRLFSVLLFQPLIIFLEAVRSLARAGAHGLEQGYADVRGTGQTIHRAKVFGYTLETRSWLRGGQRNDGGTTATLSWARFACISSTVSQ